MVVQACQFEANLAAVALRTDQCSKMKYMSNFKFIGRFADDRQIALHRLFELAASRVDKLSAPFSVEGFRGRIIKEVGDLSGQILPSELPEGVEYKQQLCNVQQNEDESEYFDVRRSNSSAVIKTTISDMIRILPTASTGLYIQSSTDCGKLNRYKARSWFKIVSIRLATRTFNVQGPIEGITEAAIKEMAPTKLQFKSFVTIEPMNKDESPEMENY